MEGSAAVRRRPKQISHEDRLPLIDHLDELRSRLIVSMLVYGVALALCFCPAEGFFTTFTVAGYFGVIWRCLSCSTR